MNSGDSSSLIKSRRLISSLHERFSQAKLAATKLVAKIASRLAKQLAQAVITEERVRFAAELAVEAVRSELRPRLSSPRARLCQPFPTMVLLGDLVMNPWSFAPTKHLCAKKGAAKESVRRVRHTSKTVNYHHWRSVQATERYKPSLKI